MGRRMGEEREREREREDGETGRRGDGETDVAVAVYDDVGRGLVEGMVPPLEILVAGLADALGVELERDFDRLRPTLLCPAEALPCSVQGMRGRGGSSDGETERSTGKQK